jgi:hypothetical protein
MIEMSATAKIIARYTARLVVRLLLTILAGDLLYLYYAGSWYDPIRAIEIAEVILLYVFIVTGLVLTHREALKCRPGNSSMPWHLI